MWRQITYKDGARAQTEITRTDADMIRILTQLILEQQAGGKFELHERTDDRFNPKFYTITRQMKGYTMTYEFEKI